MESPIVRIVIIAAAVAAAAGVVAIMWSVINTNTEGIDDQSAIIPYESIESQTLCESVDDGAWIRKLSGTTAQVTSKTHDDVTWQGEAKCIDAGDLPSTAPGTGTDEDDAINRKTGTATYAAGDINRWVLFNTDARPSS